VLLSPASQWLLKSMEKIDFNSLKVATNVKSDPLVQEYVFEGDIEDMDSCPSTMTYESSGEFLDPGRANNANLTQETYSKLWNQFVDALWNSTDSLWILPCCSDEKPRPLANNVSSNGGVTQTKATNNTTTSCDNDQWLSPCSQMEQQRQKIFAEVIDQFVVNRFDNVSLNENRLNKKSDYDQWLLKTKIGSPSHDDAGIGDPSKSISTTIADLNLMEDWLGWKGLLEKVHSMGDQCWLYHPPGLQQRDSTKVDQTTMEY